MRPSLQRAPRGGGAPALRRPPRAQADAVLLPPAHQFPTGAALAPGRRTALLAWLRGGDAVAIDDDYDAEYRYDCAPLGALQGLDPDRSCTPAP